MRFQHILHVRPPVSLSVLPERRYNSETIKAEGCGGSRGSGKRHLRSPTVTDMRFFSTLALPVTPFAVSATAVTWDPVYDDGTRSLSTVACSDGTNGLLTKGYAVFKDLPTFPNIGGSSVVESWNSPNCGSPSFTQFDPMTDTHGSPYNRHLLEYHLPRPDNHSNGN